MLATSQVVQDGGGQDYTAGHDGNHQHRFLPSRNVYRDPTQADNGRRHRQHLPKYAGHAAHPEKVALRSGKSRGADRFQTDRHFMQTGSKIV
jgi:hypothetical protein